MADLEIGAAAPAFTLPADGGKTVSLSDLAGQKVVLYLYPRDDTPGCTKEAIGFTEKKAEFEAAGAVVLGLSKDTVAKHDKFIAKHDLGVTLLSDEDNAVIDAYGSWVEKSMYGKKSMGIERSTFLIDGQGNLARIWRKVKVPGHVDEVLEAVQAL
ncbi:MAG: thioredoxin-dependent thiol peroxidase [Pseudomonadota bacterium]